MIGWLCLIFPHKRVRIVNAATGEHAVMTGDQYVVDAVVGLYQCTRCKSLMVGEPDE